MTATILRVPTFGASPSEASPSAVAATIPRVRIERLHALEDAAVLAQTDQVRMFTAAVEAVEGYAEAITTMQRFLAACGCGAEGREAFIENMEATMRAAKMSDDAAPATAPVIGMVLVAKTSLNFNGRRYSRGAEVPPEIAMSRNGQALLKSALEWRPADKATGQVVDLPEPEAPMLPDPTSETLVEVIKAAARAHQGDPVAAWFAAKHAAAEMLDPRRAGLVGDLLLGTPGGSDLYQRAVRTDAERVARANNLTARRPVRAL